MNTEQNIKGLEYIRKIREYLSYVETHLKYVYYAFQNLTDACKDTWWVKDIEIWNTLHKDILNHDISKFSKEEFIPYVEHFYPIDGKKPGSIDSAWSHHKNNNSHHYESLKTDIDVVHMVIDWTAMGYMFGDNAQEYYERNKNKIKLNSRQKQIVTEMFVCISEYNNRR